jgi:hypothetical protein
MTDRVKRLRNSREWLNNGECCGDTDSVGTCAAPACIFGEAVKELQLAADRIEKLEAALRKIADIHPFKDPEGDVSVKSLVDLVFHINITARKALEGKDD